VPVPQPPPDLEPTNHDRAEWAAAALRHFQCTTGTDYEDALDDLLGDLLRHYSQGLFGIILAISLSNRTSLVRHSRKGGFFYAKVSKRHGPGLAFRPDS
jgi:hypothetical protein